MKTDSVLKEQIEKLGDEPDKTVFVVIAWIGDEECICSRLCGVFSDAFKAEVRRREIEENASYHKGEAGELDMEDEKKAGKYFLYEAKYGDWVNMKIVEVCEIFMDMPLFNFEEMRMINVR